MTIDSKEIQHVHKHFSAACFNQAWDLIDLPKRSAEQEAELLALAFASHWHWTQREDYSPAKASISNWQISRVFALIGDGPMAIRFGEKALNVLTDPNESPFLAAYAYEAQARGHAVQGNDDAAISMLEQAVSHSAQIESDENRTLVTADLEQLQQMLNQS